MQSQLKNLIFSPRLWLSAGVFSIGVSIVVGYHQDQMIAQNALARKVTFPEKVMIQHFSSNGHENILNEVHLLAEAGFDQTIRIDVGNETAPRLVDIVPIYPVSRQTLPVARSVLEQRRRPVSRDHAPQLAEQHMELARVEPLAMGLLIFEAAEAPAPPNFGQMKYAEGSNGSLVKLAGVSIGASSIVEQASGPLAENGVRLITNALVVSPHLRGRIVGSGITDYSSVRNAFVWASALMMTFGFALLFSLLPSSRKSKKPEASYQVKAVGAFPAVDPFQPIAAQDELVNGKGSRMSRLFASAASRNRR